MGRLDARVLEPELMDDAEQAAAYAGADFASVNAEFVERFCNTAGMTEGAVLDLGCGPGDIALRLCRALPGVSVTAVDGAAAMLAHAHVAVAEAGLAGRVELVRGLVPGALETERRFEAVVSNSLLHHLPDPLALWNEIIATANTGAAVLVMDLRRPDTTEEARRLVDEYAAEEPRVLRDDFYNSLCAAFTVDEVTRQLERCDLHGCLTAEPVGDRHLIVTGRIA